MTDALDIGFVGSGFMGQLAHLRHYDRIDDCNVVALAEPQERLAERVARRYDVPSVYRDHSELLAAESLDAVVAVQPYRHHHRIVPEILATGTPLFTEKPLAVAPDTGEELADLSDETETLHMVGYHKRSDPAMAYAKRVVDEWRGSGEFGDLRFVRITMPPGDWIAGAPDPIRTDETPPSIEGEPFPDEFDEETAELYDHVINYYVHQINAFRFFFGEPYSVSYADPSGTLVAVESESGVAGTLEMAPYETSEDWQESVLVGFDRGYVKIELPPPLEDGRAGRVEVMRNRGDGTRTTDSTPSAAEATQTMTEPAMPRKAAMRAQAENFLAAVRGERPPPCDSREAVEDLKVAREYVRLRNERSG